MVRLITALLVLMCLIHSLASLSTLSRDIDQFPAEQRQQAALDLIDQAAASLNAEIDSRLTHPRDSDDGAQGALIYDLERARKSLLGPAKP
jgi:Tfp pilus assembly ATPase PilU